MTVIEVHRMKSQSIVSLTMRWSRGGRPSERLGA